MADKTSPSPKPVDLPDNVKKVKSEQISINQYKTLKAEQARKQAKAFKLPAAVKIILALPLILLFLFGIFYIPYMFIAAMTNPAPAENF